MLPKVFQLNKVSSLSLRRGLTYALCLLLITPLSSHARTSNTAWSSKFTNQRLSEFFYSPIGNELLISVKVLGNVERPGLYHVPSKTSLLTLLSLSGGFKAKADIEKILVNKKNKQPVVANFNDLVNTGKDFSLAGNDMVYVPKEEYFFGQNTVNTAAVVSSIIGIILAGIVLTEKVER